MVFICVCVCVWVCSSEDNWVLVLAISETGLLFASVNPSLAPEFLWDSPVSASHPPTRGLGCMHAILFSFV